MLGKGVNEPYSLGQNDSEIHNIMNFKLHTITRGLKK